MNSSNYLGSGRHRKVFLSRSGKYVIKVPHNDGGFRANQEEYDLYCNQAKSSIPLAKCRLHKSDILLMEFVKSASWRPDLPEWVRSVDCQQVGYTRTGKLVAYDYSLC